MTDRFPFAKITRTTQHGRLRWCVTDYGFPWSQHRTRKEAYKEYMNLIRVAIYAARQDPSEYA